MSTDRELLLDWARQGRLSDVRRALALAGVTPDGAAWMRFASSLALWLGTVLLAASVVFFVAYNWDVLGRFGKFALVEVLWIATVVAALVAGTERIAGKAALLAAALLTGALLALIGQTYQTGADTYELFASWAALILPWVLIARVAGLWLLFIALLNLAVSLYFQTFHGFLGVFLGSQAQLWILAALNTGALIVWEWRAHSGAAWMHGRWPARVLLAASGACVTLIALHAIFEFREAGLAGFAAYAVWMVAVYAWYRWRSKDVFALAGAVLSGIVVIAAFLGKHLLSSSVSVSFLFIGLVVIGLSAAGAWWLRRVAAEAE